MWIPYDSSLVLGGVVDDDRIAALQEVAQLQQDVEAHQDSYNAQYRNKLALDMSMEQLKNMKIGGEDEEREKTMKKLEQAQADQDQAAMETMLKLVNARMEFEAKYVEMMKAREQTKVDTFVESPLDFDASVIETLPIGTDTMNMDVQYFRNESTDQAGRAHVHQVAKHVADSVSHKGIGFSGSAKVEQETEHHMSTQIEQNSVVGTLVIIAKATHNKAKVYDAKYDAKKLVRVWNAKVTGHKIDLPGNIDEHFAEWTMKDRYGQTGDDDPSIAVLTGQTYGSTFIGFIHFVRKSRTANIELSARAGLKVVAEQDESDWKPFYLKSLSPWRRGRYVGVNNKGWGYTYGSKGGNREQLVMKPLNNGYVVIRSVWLKKNMTAGHYGKYVRFSSNHEGPDEHFKLTKKGRYHFLTSRKTGNQLQVTENGFVKCDSTEYGATEHFRIVEGYDYFRERDVDKVRGAQQQVNQALAATAMGGSFGLDSSAAAEIKALMSSNTISSHVSVQTYGVIPSIASQGVKYVLDKFSSFSANETDEKLTLLAQKENKKNGSNKGFTAQRNKAIRAGQISGVERAKIHAVLSGMKKGDEENNKELTMHSIMIAFDDYVKNVRTAEGGTPLTFFCATLRRDDVIACWMQECRPDLYKKALNGQGQNARSESSLGSGGEETSEGESDDE